MDSSVIPFRYFDRAVLSSPFVDVLKEVGMDCLDVTRVESLIVVTVIKKYLRHSLISNRVLSFAQDVEVVDTQLVF